MPDVGVVPRDLGVQVARYIREQSIPAVPYAAVEQLLNRFTACFAPQEGTNAETKEDSGPGQA